MSIESIVPFMTVIAAMVGLAALVLVVSVTMASIEFFAEHRAERVASHQPMGRYYRQLALGH